MSGENAINIFATAIGWSSQLTDKDTVADVIHIEGIDEAAVAALHHQLWGAISRRPLEKLHAASNAGQHLALCPRAAPSSIDR